MAHNIKEDDKGLVGFTGQYGKTWHGLPQYEHKDGPLDMDEVKKILCFPCELVDLASPSLLNEDGENMAPVIFTGFKGILRTDTNKFIGKPVGEDYQIVLNDHLCLMAEMILDAAPNIQMESAGTLMNGGMTFLNLTLAKYQIDGDISACVTKLMISQGFGGSAPVESCLHETRIVCDNTRRMAEHQGKVNGTLTRFKHTKNVHTKLAQKVGDLIQLINATQENITAMNILAKSFVTKQFVKDFLIKLLAKDEELAEAAQAANTRKENRAALIENIFCEKPDLIALPDTKYKLLQAVTDYADHSQTRKGNDSGSIFISNLNGTSDKMKNKAFKMLMTTV